jgi:hypothetical protein
MGEKRTAYRLLIGKTKGKRPLERPRRRCLNNIKRNLGEMKWGFTDYTGLSHDKDRWTALVNTVMNLRVA